MNKSDKLVLNVKLYMYILFFTVVLLLWALELKATQEEDDDIKDRYNIVATE